MKRLLSCEFNMDTACVELKLSLIHIFSLSDNTVGGSTPCCRPLIAYLQRRAGLSTAALAPFILTVDWLGWLCYSVISFSYCQRKCR